MDKNEILEDMESSESALSNNGVLTGTVSGGDSMTTEPTVEEQSDYEAGIGSTIVEVILSAEQNDLFERNNELLENLTAIVEEQNQPIMEKPLSKYTTLEGLLLIVTVFLLGIILGKIIGGIIPCKH